MATEQRSCQGQAARMLRLHLSPSRHPSWYESRRAQGYPLPDWYGCVYSEVDTRAATPLLRLCCGVSNSFVVQCCLMYFVAKHL